MLASCFHLSSELSGIHIPGATLNATQFSDLNWVDKTCWIIEGYEDNVAVPDYERLPCEYDDIVFPFGIYTKAFGIYGYQLKVKSFKFKDEYWSNEDLVYNMKQTVISCKLNFLFNTIHWS